MTINRTTFLAYVRKAPFGNRLTQEQVDGLNCILDVWGGRNAGGDSRWLAYILATAFHETGGRMAPVREGFAKSDTAARKIVAGRMYGKEDATTKQVYYGRGLVQLTWSENYKRLGTVLGLDLYKNPDALLDLTTSANVLIEGMTRGLSSRGDFTGRCVEDYFNGQTDDPEGARAVINGKDKASLIASYHRRFLAAIEAADEKTPQPADVVAADAVADAPALTTDKTMLGTITSIAGAGGAGLLGAINNPWAFGALVVVALGVILFLTGRLEIRRKAGA